MTGSANLRLLLLASSALVATAGGAAAAILNLDTITVLATRTEEKAIDSLAGVSIVSTEAIENLAPSRTGEIFAGLPSIYADQKADDPGVGLGIRGLQDFGRVAVVIDGARQNFQRSGHIASGLFYVDPELLSEVEVSRGPVSNIYGSGAIGGVASLTTKGIDDILTSTERYGAVIKGLAGTNDGELLGSFFGGVRPTDQFDFVFGGSFTHTDDYSDGHGDEVENTGSETASGLAKATFRPADGHTFKLGAVYYDTSYLSGQSGETAVYDNHVVNQTYTLAYAFNRPDMPLVDFAASAYWNGTKADQTVVEPLGLFGPDDYSGPVGTERTFDIATKGFDLHNTSRFDALGLSHALTLGGDFFRDNVTTDSTGDPGSALTPEGQRDVSGSFAQWQANYSTWLETITAVRYDAYKLDGDGDEASGHRLSPKFTLGITPVKGFTFYGTYAEGYRAPAITETLIDGFHPGDIFKFIPNPDLKPEIGKTVEFGINAKYDSMLAEGDAFRLKADVFQNNVTDYIDLNFVNNGPTSDCFFGMFGPECYQYQNISSARLQSVELQATYDAGKWFSQVSGQHIDGKNLDTGERLTSTPPDQVALTLGARFFDNKLTVAPRWQHVFAATIPETDTSDAIPYDAFDLVGLTVAYQPNQNVTGTLTLNNLFNVFYVPYLQNLPAPGFSVKAALKVKIAAE